MATRWARSAARPGAIGHTAWRRAVILPAPGQVLLFSGAQLHATIPNTSGLARYSADFRTVDVPDLMAGRGAPLTDVHCTGTAIRDFVSVADESSFDEEWSGRCTARRRTDAMLVFGADRPRGRVGECITGLRGITDVPVTLLCIVVCRLRQAT